MYKESYNVVFRCYGDKGKFVGSDTADCVYLSAEAERIVNPKSRFTVVPSAKHDDRVHIKSYYTNKFWRSKFQGSKILAAVASEPVEDLSLWNSTLFRLEYSGPNLMFYHCSFNDYYGKQVGVKFETYYRRSVLSSEGNGKYFFPINTDSIVKLPKRVTFYDNNWKILWAWWQERHQYHAFIKKDPCQDCVEHEIFYTEDGDIRVKSVYYGKFWRRSPNWIWSDSDDTTSHNPDTVFQVVPLGDNVIALRNKGNHNFCIGLTKEGKYNSLNAHVPNIIPSARLFVGEPTLSRDIKVHFRLKDAAFSSERPLQMASVTVPNKTDKDHEIEQGFRYTKAKTTSWSTTLTVTTGVKANIKSGLPFIAEGKIEVSFEISAAVQFGKSETISEEVNSTYKVPVPAKTKVIVKLLATQAEYDIPFSYTQTDIRYNGDWVFKDLEDGMYHGVECYNFYYDTEYVPL